MLKKNLSVSFILTVLFCANLFGGTCPIFLESLLSRFFSLTPSEASQSPFRNLGSLLAHFPELRKYSNFLNKNELPGMIVEERKGWLVGLQGQNHYSFWLSKSGEFKIYFEKTDFRDRHRIEIQNMAQDIALQIGVTISFADFNRLPSYPGQERITVEGSVAAKLEFLQQFWSQLEEI